MKKTVFLNGKVYLSREKFAEAIFVIDGLIEAVGSNEEILDVAGGLEGVDVIDCHGNTVIPGLNDSHMHLVQVGEAMNQVKIDDVKSVDELVRRCKDFMKEHPHLTVHGVHALGWNQDLFEDEKRIPNRHDLDRISTEVPVILERICGHVLSANSKAIELLGLTGDSPQYPDGEFLIGEDGQPNGIFCENACNFVKYLVPDFSYEDRKRMTVQVMEYAVSCGLTSVQSNDVGTTMKDDSEGFRLFKELYEEGKALLRYRHQTCFNNLNKFKEYLEGEFKSEKYDPMGWLTLGPLKLFKDGSLGARTALMRQEYADNPGNFGITWMKDQDMREYCRLAKEYDLQVITHVIGDKAIEDTIKCYEEEGFIDGKNQLRHSLVHCQITDRQMLEDIAKAGICVFAQPIFLDYDMKIVESRCGKELASTSYAFKTLKDLGVHVGYGTDAPVEDCNPFPVIYMAVTRKDKRGRPEEGFYPKECVDIYDAVDAYTYESAYLEFMEDRKGRIKEGYYADLVVLDKDIFTIDPMEIKDVKPLMTIVGGKIVYKA